MKCLFFFKGLLLTALILVVGGAAPANALITVHSFGPDGTGSPQLISPLNTVIGPKTGIDPEYHALTSSNTQFQFVRHVYSVEENICFYWFRADGDPASIPVTERWSDVYYYVGNAGANPCEFVDGAEYGSNNFVILFDNSLNNIVGVLQYDLNDSNDPNDPARLLAYAVNPYGMTFAEGVAAIQAIPEPSTVTIAALALLGGAWKLRRRKLSN